MKKVKTKEVSSLLEGVDFFTLLNDDEKKMLFDYSSYEVFPAKEVIVRQGEYAVDFYMVLEGEVEGIHIKKGSLEVISKIGVGQCFGETAILEKTIRETTYRAGTTSTVLRMDINAIKQKKLSLFNKLLKKTAYALHETVQKLKSDFSDHLKKQGVANSYYGTRGNAFYTRDNHLSSQDLDQLVKPARIKLTVQASDQQHEAPSSLLARAGGASGEKAGSIKQAFETQNIKQDQITSKKAEEKKQAEDFSLEKYDTIIRKLYMQNDKALSVIPELVSSTVQEHVHHYLVGKEKGRWQNFPWSQHLFVQGTHKLKHSLHLVVLCPYGELAYRSCFGQIPFSHRVVGRSDASVVGSFLRNNHEIENYLNDENSNLFLRLDKLMPIDRPPSLSSKTEEMGKEKDSASSSDTLEVLSHTAKDVKENTLFLIFDNEMGNYTSFIKLRFPNNPILTVIRGYECETKELSSLLTLTERRLSVKGLMKGVDKTPSEKGFVQGSCLFLPDFSPYYANNTQFGDFGFVFGTIALCCGMGASSSSVAWGSKGGTTGVLKAVQTLYGNRGPKDIKDVEAAVRWADALKSRN